MINDIYNTANRSLDLNGNVILKNKAYSICSKVYGNKMFTPTSGDNPFKIPSSTTGNLIQLKDTDIALVKGNEIYYLDKDYVGENPLIGKYKVTIGIMNPDRGGVNNSTMWNVINVPKLLAPNWVIAKNFMVLYASDKIEPAQCFVSFIKTKFARFLILQAIAGVSLSTKSNWAFVPDLEMTHPWDDKQLYAKYNLAEEEIAYIESTIKPMK